MLVFVIPRPDSSLYTAIKRTCCCELAIPSQVVTKKNVAPNQPKTMSVVTKVAIQMSCKIGGSPWGVFVSVEALYLLFKIEFLIAIIILVQIYNDYWC
jgi:aubergine-like protein